MSKKREDTNLYHVVVNNEPRYSLWPQDRELPEGWKLTGMSGLQTECVDYIGDIWMEEPVPAKATK